jgi:hypothetical protein
MAHPPFQLVRPKNYNLVAVHSIFEIQANLS